MPAEQMSAALRWLLYGEPARCGCTGECGLRHLGGRCHADQPADLMVAAIDPGVTPPVVGAVPADELGVWCRDCRTHAEAIARDSRRPAALAAPAEVAA